jgi:colanic acid/amylovoran biosynthesis glycosyltransferase
MFMNLCITRSNKYSYSETFIDNQIKELQPKILLYEGWYPSILPNGKSFLSFPLNYLFVRGGLRNLFPKIYHEIYTNFLASFLKNQQIDTLLANYGPMGVALLDACERVNVKLFVHFHGFDASEYKTLDDYKDRYKTLFQKVEGVIVVSNDMKKQLLNLGADLTKIYLNPYGVETNKFTGASPETKAPIFITVGRFTAKKAPQLTIKAFLKVLDKIPNAQMIMIGDGELWEESKQLVNELNISDKIDFQGKKSPEQIAEQLREARIFVQHSRIAENGDSEGTPNTILEASATGLPIVSTRHAGIKDAVVHGETGFLVEEGDWETMADYMIQLAQDPALCGKMGRAARQHIEENYEMSKRVQTLKDILAK